MKENNDYFDTKTEAEKLNNVSDIAMTILNGETVIDVTAKSTSWEKSDPILREITSTVKSIISKKTEPVVIQPTNEIDPIVDLVNQSLSTPHSTGLLSKHKPRSIFTPQ
jgi:hypothetical protein